MSKSLGNVIDPEEIIEKFGVDVVRNFTTLTNENQLITELEPVDDKDSLYCDGLESPRRKQIITVLYYLLAGLLKIIAPLLPFLAEEVYENIPFNFGYAKKETRQTKIIHTSSQAQVLVIPKKELKVSQFSSLNLSRLLLIARIEFTEGILQTDFCEEQNYLAKILKTSSARCIRC
ncbi:15973_t:CDS:2 [Entrophospora sp. SA101]|nr:15973_t:CDS:2 [Entrophospora sp. SA101]CAJ0896362.1 7095_t:CDS:2 [Entrophospora sp. SA101]